MKKNSFLIVIFILSLGLFVALRIYADSASVRPSKAPVSTTETKQDSSLPSDSVDTVVTPSPKPDIPSPVAASDTDADNNATTGASDDTDTDKSNSDKASVSNNIIVDNSIANNTDKHTNSKDTNDTASAAGNNNDDIEENIDVDEDPDDYGLLNDTWHGDFTPVRTFKGELPRILCWGDSLTETLDLKTAYPDYLREMTGCEVINYGVNSENTSMIAMREGGVRLTVNATVIPSTCDMIPIFFTSENNAPVYMLEYGDAGINPCTIAGIHGTLRRINGAYYFTRLTEGARTSVDDGTAFTTFAMQDARSDDVLIIFTGTNDKPNPQSIYDIIDIQHKMIESSGCTKYLVIGLTYNDGVQDIDTVNDILANEYEDNFIDLRTYLMNYGINDAGLKAKSSDMLDITHGDIPSCLMKDYVHGNRYYHELLARQIYRRLQYLGYLPVE